jgi:hypothetical protein
VNITICSHFFSVTRGHLTQYFLTPLFAWCFKQWNAILKSPQFFPWYTLGIMGDKIGKKLEQVLMLNEALDQNWAGAHLHLTWALI